MKVEELVKIEQKITLKSMFVVLCNLSQILCQM